jgi:hypothetical protein
MQIIAVCDGNIPIANHNIAMKDGNVAFRDRNIEVGNRNERTTIYKKVTLPLLLIKNPKMTSRCELEGNACNAQIRKSKVKRRRAFEEKAGDKLSIE